MATMNDEARIPVYINDQQAISALKNLTAEAEKWSQKMREAMIGGDMKGMKDAQRELKGIQKEMNTLKKASFDVDHVLRNLSTTGPKELKKALAELGREQDRNVLSSDAYKKKLQLLNAEIKSINSPITQQVGFLSKLSTTFTSLPGPVGAAASGIIGLGKAMWVLVANPIGATIAAIVGSLMLLYKAISSTDSGFVKIQGALKAVGNIMDILIDRTVSYYKMFYSLVTFDWEGVKKNAKDAFGGIAKAIVDVTNAGWNYSQTMDDIDDREVAAANRMTKLRVEIETLKNEAARKTGKERMELLQKAMNKEVELNGIETGFLAERNDAEAKNLASKIQNSKLSMAQKEEQLKQWLSVDDQQLEALKQSDAAFADFVDKNEGEFQKLQKSQSDQLNKQAELQVGTRRLQQRLASETMADAKENEQKKAEREKADRDAALKELEAAYNERLILIKNAYVKESITKEEYEAKMNLAGLAHLEAQKQLLILQKQDVTAINLQIADATLKIYEENKKAIDQIYADTSKTIEGFAAGQQDITAESIDAMIKMGEDLTSEHTRIVKNTDDTNKKQAESYLDLATTIGDSFADTLMSQEQDFGQFLRNTLVLALDALEKTLALSMAQTAVTDIANKGFIGIATAAAKIVLMKAAFGTAKALVLGGGKGKAEGGFTEPGGKYEPAGIVHKGEYVIPQEGVNNPMLAPSINIIETARRNNSLARLDMRPMVQVASGSNGFANGGLVGGSAANGAGSAMVINSDPEMKALLIKLARRLDKPIKATVNKYGTNGISDAMDDISSFKSTVLK